MEKPARRKHPAKRVRRAHAVRAPAPAAEEKEKAGRFDPRGAIRENESEDEFGAYEDGRGETDPCLS